MLTVHISKMHKNKLTRLKTCPSNSESAAHVEMFMTKSVTNPLASF